VKKNGWFIDTISVAALAHFDLPMAMAVVPVVVVVAVIPVYAIVIVAWE